jgi:citrate synthase
MTNKNKRIIQGVDEGYSQRTASRIAEEVPSQHNPYIAERINLYGYDLLELMQKRSYVDVLFLLFKGDLPSKPQAQLLETLLIAFINPGPRHPATRAAMNAAVGKTRPVHILPIGLQVGGGAWLGGMEVSEAMQWLKEYRKQDATSLARQLCNEMTNDKEGDQHIAPGFGSRFGDIDRMPQQILEQLVSLPGHGSYLDWASAFSGTLEQNRMGCLATGVMAAALLDLGFHPRSGAGMFQLISAPGILAHGLELSNKPRTAMPFLDDDHYFIETDDTES